MSIVATSRPSKPGRQPAKAYPTYRGVRLQTPYGRSRFTLDQIIRAVDAALEKNADALAPRTKA
jgi:hypothetical protein